MEVAISTMVWYDLFPALLSMIRILAGLVFLLLLPGFILLAACFPRRDDVETLERLGLSIAISITVTAVAAVALNYSPWGIQTETILVAIGCFSLVFLLIAIYRGKSLPVTERLLAIKRKEEKPAETKWTKVILVLLCICILVGFSFGSFLGSTPEFMEEAFTQFYILGKDGTSDRYPGAVVAGEPIAIRIGLANHEQIKVEYRIERISMEGTEQILNRSLEYEEVWEMDDVFRLQSTGNQKVYYQLYKGNETTPYRTLFLFITVR